MQNYYFLTALAMKYPYIKRDFPYFFVYLRK